MDRRHAMGMERLESRQVLSGVTLITHGFNSDADGWVAAMADAIAARPDLAIDQPRYRIDVTDPGHDGGPLEVVTTSRSGPLPTSATTLDPEIVLLLNWSDLAGEIALGGTGYYRSTTDVANAVAEKLLSPGFLPDLATPLAELPFHLMGHSRGASLVGELAHQLGTHGVWVQQVTTWDPHPVDGVREPWLFNVDFGDGPMDSSENVVFWDNYWRTQGDRSFDFTGEPVANTANVQLSETVLADGGYGFEHSDTHLWYHGTVDLSQVPPANDSFEDVPNTWFGGAHPARDASGFFYSRMIDGARPLEGLSHELGGTAVRTAVDWTAANWPNVVELQVVGATSAFAVGDDVPVGYYHQDADSDATIALSFDPDRNPYNGNQLLASEHLLGQTTTLSLNNALMPTSPLSPGAYYITAKITDSGGRTRYAYAPQQVILQDVAEIDDVAIGETTAIGRLVSGSYFDTWVSDDIQEHIRERFVGSNPVKRRTLLDHRWTIDVTGGASVTFFAEAFHTSAEEDFAFVYFNGTSWVPMFAVSNTANVLQSFSLPDTTSGPLIVRIVDTGRSPGEASRDSVFVDQLFVRSTASSSTASMAIDRVMGAEGEFEAAIAVLFEELPNSLSLAAAINSRVQRSTVGLGRDFDGAAAESHGLGPRMNGRSAPRPRIHGEVSMPMADLVEPHIRRRSQAKLSPGLEQVVAEIATFLCADRLLEVI